MDPQDRWRIKGMRNDLSRLLRALRWVVMDEATLYLEGPRPPKAVEAFLRRHQSPTKLPLARGTFLPRQRTYHALVNPDMLSRLATLVENLPSEDVCVHLHVYKGDVILVEGFDVFYDTLYLSKHVSEDKVRAFCAELGCSFDG